MHLPARPGLLALATVLTVVSGAVGFVAIWAGPAVSAVS
jgi:hypothetical protein